MDLRTITLGVPPQEVCNSNPFKNALSHKKEWPLIKFIFANFNSHHNFLSTFGMYLFFHGKYCYNIHQAFSLFSQYVDNISLIFCQLNQYLLSQMVNVL